MYIAIAVAAVLLCVSIGLVNIYSKTNKLLREEKEKNRRAE